MLRHCGLAAIHGLVITLLIACGAPQSKAPEPDPTPLAPVRSDRAIAVDAIVAELIEGRWATTVSIAIIDPDGVEYFNYGEARAGVPADEYTVYEIGSISKAFNGVLLAAAVQRGELDWDTAVADVWATLVPSRQDVPMTLRHLVTHTSGLPRMLKEYDLVDPYGAFSEQDLVAWLQTDPQENAAGENFSYSNLGAAWLGEILRQQAGVASWEALLEERITGPLGLDDTTVDAGNPERVAQGHDGGLRPVPLWGHGVLVAHGMVRSNTRDMAAFVIANLEPPATQAGDALRASHEILYERSCGGVASGWMIGSGEDCNPHVIWHNGGTGGFTSFAAFDTQKGVGVVVLANTASRGTDVLGRVLFERLQTGEISPLGLPAWQDTDPELLTEIAGRYSIPFLLRLDVTAGDNVIDVAFDQGAGLIFAREEGLLFRDRFMGLTIEFERDESGAIYRAVFGAGGDTLAVPRFDE